jgi:hypothetical protein
MDHNEINTVLVGLPMQERLVALVVSIMDKHPQAVTAGASLVNMAATMASLLPEHERKVLAEYMHDVAMELIETRH